MQRLLSLAVVSAMAAVLWTAVADAREGVEGPGQAPRHEAVGGQRPGGGMGGGGMGGSGMGGIDPQMLVENPRMIKELGLQTNQVETLKKMLFEMRRSMIRIEADKDIAALKQAELMSKDEPDEAEVMKAVDDVVVQQAKIAKLRTQYLLNVLKTLTPEQRSKAREILHKMRPMGERPRGEMMKKFKERAKEGDAPRQTDGDDDDDED